MSRTDAPERPSALSMPTRSTSRWRDRAHAGRTESADQSRRSAERRGEFDRARPRAHVEPHVGLDRRRIELDAGDLGKPSARWRIGVIGGEPLDVVIEGVQAGGGDDPGEHGAADLLLDPPRHG